MTTSRTVVSRHRGKTHGPITRLISPSDVGELLKPFIFLDFFNAHVEQGFGFPMHPHSGIATLTWQPGSDLRYQDTTGKNGVLKAGGLEWMNAGGGAWHQGSFETEGLATGFQLWVPMPPAVEDGPSVGQYVPPQAVPTRLVQGGCITLLLGQMPVGGDVLDNPIESHQDMNYFVLDLEANAQWRYMPPEHHDVAWAFVFQGAASVADTLSSLELLVLGSAGDISFASGDTATRILVGSACKHPHDLVLGPSSVHTNAVSLQQGLARIRALGETLSK